MKHTLKVTIGLVLFFFMAQFAGLLIVNSYIDHERTIETKIVAWQPLPYKLERPEVKNQSTSFIYITIAVLIGTIIVLLLIRFNKPFIWKFWFFITVWLTLSISFAAFLDNMLAAIIALIAAMLKLYKPNIIIQNLSEIFIYGGLAAIFVPMMNLFAAFMLLILISIYDYVSVFKTKHMIKLAKFQSRSKVFAGLMIPYRRGKVSEFAVASENARVLARSRSGTSEHTHRPQNSIAILGGGDIGFTLLFAGVVMKGLMLKETVLIGFLKTLIIPIFVTLALLILLLKGERNKFYPAMPFLSLGCFVGYLVLLVI